MMPLKHQAAPDRKLRAAIRQVEGHFPPGLPPLVILSDPVRLPDPVAATRNLRTGAGIIYRHFGAADRFEVAEELAEVAQRRGLVLLIAADPELAQSVGASGVHWPEARLGSAQRWRGRFLIQTASAHSRRAIWKAGQMGMDAALVSAIFPSESPSAGVPLGPHCLRKLSATAKLPVYGLGGVNRQTAMKIAAVAGLAGISVFSERSGSNGY